MMIGLPAIVYPSGSNRSSSCMLPSWKIQTRAPKLAVRDRSVITTALSGIASEPNSRNRITAEASRVVPTAHGMRCDWAIRKSSPTAAAPPTCIRVIAGSSWTARTREISAVPAGSDDLYGLMASSRTVLPRMYASFNRAIPAARSGGSGPGWL